MAKPAAPTSVVSADGIVTVRMNKMLGDKPGASGLSFQTVPGRGHLIERVTPGYAAS